MLLTVILITVRAIVFTGYIVTGYYDQGISTGYRTLKTIDFNKL